MPAEKLTRAKAKDAEEIVALAADLFPDEFTGDKAEVFALRQIITKDPEHGGFVLTLRHGRELIGFVVVSPHTKEGFLSGKPAFLYDRNLAKIQWVGIHENHRGQGLGGELIRKAAEGSKTRGFKALSALVHIDKQKYYDRNCWDLLGDDVLLIWACSESNKAALMHKQVFPRFTHDSLAWVGGIAAQSRSNNGYLIYVLDSSFSETSWSIPLGDSSKFNTVEVLTAEILKGERSFSTLPASTIEHLRPFIAEASRRGNLAHLR